MSAPMSLNEAEAAQLRWDDANRATLQEKAARTLISMVWQAVEEYCTGKHVSHQLLDDARKAAATARRQWADRVVRYGPLDAPEFYCDVEPSTERGKFVVMPSQAVKDLLNGVHPIRLIGPDAPCIRYEAEQGKVTPEKVWAHRCTWTAQDAPQA